MHTQFPALPTYPLLTPAVPTAVLGTVLTYIQSGHCPRVQRTPVRLTQSQTHDMAPVITDTSSWLRHN